MPSIQSTQPYTDASGTIVRANDFGFHAIFRRWLLVYNCITSDDPDISYDNDRLAAMRLLVRSIWSDHALRAVWIFYQLCRQLRLRLTRDAAVDLPVPCLVLVGAPLARVSNFWEEREDTWEHLGTQCSFTASFLMMLFAPPKPHLLREAQRMAYFQRSAPQCWLMMPISPPTAMQRAFAISQATGKTFAQGFFLENAWNCPNGNEVDTNDLPYRTFAHVFVIAIQGDKWTMWSSWVGEYDLCDWLQRDGDRSRDMDEAWALWADWAKLEMHQGPWDEECNRIIKEWFDVDFQRSCDAKDEDAPSNFTLRLFGCEYEVDTDSLAKFVPSSTQ